MLKLNEFLNVTRYSVDEKTFLKDSVYSEVSELICEVSSSTPDYHLVCVFDVISHEVFEIIAEDFKNKRYYRWITEDFRDTSKLDKNWPFPKDYSEIEVAKDILAKADSMVEGRDYDTRIQVPLDLSDEDFLMLARAAHERDITLNALVELAIRSAIEKEQHKG